VNPDRRVGRKDPRAIRRLLLGAGLCAIAMAQRCRPALRSALLSSVFGASHSGPPWVISNGDGKWISSSRGTASSPWVSIGGGASVPDQLLDARPAFSGHR